MKKIRIAAMAATALAAATIAAPASAATVVLNGLDSITSHQARIGYQAAADYWAKTLTNDTTIVFNVAFDALDEGVLGSTGSYRGEIHVLDVYDGLVAQSQSALDAQAVASVAAQLALGGGYAINANITNVATGATVFDANRSYNNQILYANSAVMKALDVTGYTGPDADITFSSEYAFDFDPRDGITAGYSDFIGVAIHEMGHGLGFVSGVDYYDLIACPNGPYCGAITPAQMNNDSWMNVLDLFRYSSAGVVDWTVDTPSYFSFDNGLTQFNGNTKFSSGEYNGDGWQASHWQAPRSLSNPNAFSCLQPKIGIMNPYLCEGQEAEITATDLAAFDAIGWNLNTNVLTNPGYRSSSSDVLGQYLAAVPEPSTWALLILGFGLTGAAMRRKSKVQARYAF